MNLLKSLKRIVILLLAFLVLYNSYCILTYAAQDEEDITTQLSSKEYTIDNKEGVIKRILPETTIKSFKANFSVPENDITIYTDSSCSKEAIDGFVVSGMILKAKDIETKFQICVIGDLDNDGKMGEVELNKLINHVVGISENKLTGLSAISADINGDGNIDQIDITILIRWVVDRVLDIPEMKLPQAPNIEVISGEKGENDWYKSNVKVKISNKKDLGAEISKLTYKLDDQEEKEITDNSIIELSENGIHNITAYTYSKEGVKNNITRKIKIDKINPKEAVISLNKKEEITGNTIVANVTQQDDESGISIENCKWIYNNTKDNLGINNEIWNTANTFNNNTNEINLVTHKKGTYYLHVLTVDNAGNKTEKTSEAINIRQLVNQISLNKNSTNIMYEMTEKLTAVIDPSDADNKNLVWTSSDENIATVSQDGQINAIALGEATITVSTQDGSNLSATCTVVVTSKQISNNFSITLPNETYTYDGTEKTPELTIKDGETVLVKDTDYTVSYQNNTNAGTATATVTGINNYAGTTSVNFTINKAENPLMVTNPSTIYVQDQVNLENNVSNNQGTVSYSVKSTSETTPGSLNSSTYTAGTLSTNNDNDASVVITVTASGNSNYNPKSMDITITVQKYTPTLSWTSTTPDSVTYNTTGKSATVSASNVGGTLGTITYSSSNTSVITINASTGALTTVSGTGSSTITANIARTSTVKVASTTKTINVTKTTNPTEINSIPNLVYTGSPLNLVTASNVQGTVYYSTITSLNSSNYNTNGSTTIPTATNVGDYTVYYYVTGNTNYDFKSGNVTVSITSKSIEQSNFSVTLPSETYTYDGTSKMPVLTVKDGSKVLVKDVDYMVFYENNVDAGIATATVTGINNYAGTTSINFTIVKAENPLTVDSSVDIFVQSSIDLANSVHNSQGTVSYSVKSTNETTPGSLNSSTYTAGTLSTSDDSNGEVVITVTAAGNRNYKPKSMDIPISVQKYTPTLNWTSTTPDSITYNTTGKSATVSASTMGGTVGTITYSSSNTGVLTINASTGALTTVSGTGSSTITANVARTSTVKAASTTKTISAAKATNPASISGNTSLVHTGSALNLVTASNVQGTVYYSTTTSLNSSNYQTSGSTTVPTATNVGDYTVYYYVTGNTNYNAKSGNVKATIKAAIAQINTTRYSSLQSAVNAVSTAQAATVVKLLENTEENVTISTGKNVNINLNGKNVTSNSRKPTFKVSGNNATLKISGTGEITKASQGTVIEAADGGNINITSGKISANDWTAIESSGSGSFKMSGGTIELALDESNGNYRRLIELANTGGTYIAGGTLKNTNHMRSYSAYLCGGGVLEVTDVTSIGKFWIDNENYSSVNIKGGTYTANPYWGDGDENALVIYNYDGKVATISRRNI